MDSKIELKTFVFQVEQLRMAQIRIDELEERVKKLNRTEDIKSLWDLREMSRELAIVVDQSINEFNTNTQIRIAPEQIEADAAFKSSLSLQIKAWKEELLNVTEPSRENHLLKLITDANNKLDKLLLREDDKSTWLKYFEH